MDLRKEIKLSDLLPKRSSSPKQPRSVPVAKRPAAPSEIVGLRIGATGLTAARVVNNGGKKLVDVARAPLVSGIVVGGEVRDPVALGLALEAFFTEHHLPKKGVRLGVANSRIGVRVIEIAGVDDVAQLQNAISFKAHEELSVPIDESVIDYHILDSSTDEHGVTTRRILLVVAYRDFVDRYLAATDAANLELTGIDLEAFALLRAVSEPAERTDSALIVLTIGHERTTLAISDGVDCQFARVLEWGGQAISAAIARALKVSPSEGEEIKRSVSLEAGSSRVDGLATDSSDQALAATRYELQALVREILSSLRFYQSQPGSLPIGEILVSGGTARTPGLADELERELGIRVRLADPLSRVDLGDGLDDVDASGSLAVAIGLGIED